MSWIGWDYWTAPTGHTEVTDVWPAWEQAGSLVVFWIGNTLDDQTFRLWSQHCLVDSDTSALTQDGDVVLLQELDTRSNWHIESVELLSNGSYAVWAHRRDVTSA